MTQADVLYYFPQLCRNQPSIMFSENCRTVTLLGHQQDDVQKVYHMPWTAEMNADEAAVSDFKLFQWLNKIKAQSHPLYRLDEGQYPGDTYPAFFSSFPSAEFKESFALADPLIQWEQLAHHPEFDANVNAIQGPGRQIFHFYFWEKIRIQNKI